MLNKLVCFLQTSYINGSLMEKETLRCKIKWEVQNIKTKRDWTFVDCGIISYTSYEKDIRLRVSWQSWETATITGHLFIDSWDGLYL